MTDARIDWTAVRERIERAARVAAGERTPDAVRAALAERARVLARREAVDGHRPTRRLIRFVVGGEPFALDADVVVEVRRPADLTPLPGAAAHVLGVANVRGGVLPVFDLRPLLGLSQDAVSNGPLVVVGRAGPEFGLRVDRTDDVATVPADSIRPLPGAGNGLAAGAVAGVTPDGAAVLDGAVLLGDPRFAVGER